MKPTDQNFLRDRLQETWSKLSTNKRRLVWDLIRGMVGKRFGQNVADEYLPLPDPEPSGDSESAGSVGTAQLQRIHIILEAARLVPDNSVAVTSNSPERAIVPYLGEALSSILDQSASAFRDYSTAYNEVNSPAIAPQIEDAGAYAEAYNIWIEKTALYLEDCRHTVRAVSFNELTHLWDKPAGLRYLATHHELRVHHGCDSRRVFIYDRTYWEDPILLRRLFAEVQVQLEAGVNVRVCSMEKLLQIGQGYSYPLLSFGTYDRVAMGVLIPHQTNPVVKLIHSERHIRDAVTVLDDIFDQAEPGLRWAAKQKSQMDDDVGILIASRVAELRQILRASVVRV